MAKLSDTEIGSEDMLEYLDGYSDLHFELDTLQMLRGCDFECEHGGLYQDPITSTLREFDIRALKQAAGYTVHLAIECKNVKPNFPLLVTCVPRHKSESFHNIIAKYLPMDVFTRSMAEFQSERKVFEVLDGFSLYRAGGLVVKDIAQIGRDKSGAIVANDSDVFSKWGQCLASAHALVKRAYDDCRAMTSITRSMVIPILVVPDQRLWAVAYSEDGKRKSEPEPLDRCNMFVNRRYNLGGLSGDYFVSHMEIMTRSGLIKFIREHLQDERFMNQLFPPS